MRIGVQVLGEAVEDVAEVPQGGPDLEGRLALAGEGADAGGEVALEAGDHLLVGDHEARARGGAHVDGLPGGPVGVDEGHVDRAGGAQGPQQLEGGHRGGGAVEAHDHPQRPVAPAPGVEAGGLAPDRQHRPGGEAGQPVGDRAHHQALHRPAAEAAHHHQADVLGLGELGDLPGRRALEDPGLDGHPGVLHRGGGVGEGVGHPLAHQPVVLEGGRGVEVGEAGARQLEHVDDEERVPEAGGHPRRDPGGLGGRLGEVGGAEDLHGYKAPVSRRLRRTRHT